MPRPRVAAAPALLAVLNAAVGRDWGEVEAVTEEWVAWREEEAERERGQWPQTAAQAAGECGWCDSCGGRSCTECGPCRCEDVGGDGPQLMLLPELLTAEEAERLRELAERFIGVEAAVSKVGHGAIDHHQRQSATHFLSPQEESGSPTVMALRRRAAAVLGITQEHLEPLQVQSYEAGGFYALHDDTGDTQEMRTRAATVLIYLTDANGTGGETVFPMARRLEDAPGSPSGAGRRRGRARVLKHRGRSGLAALRTACGDPEALRIAPRRGAAAAWWSRSPGGGLDQTAQHGSCPAAGGKVVAQLWAHSEVISPGRHAAALGSWKLIAGDQLLFDELPHRRDWVVAGDPPAARRSVVGAAQASELGRGRCLSLHPHDSAAIAAALLAAGGAVTLAFWVAPSGAKSPPAEIFSLDIPAARWGGPGAALAVSIVGDMLHYRVWGAQWRVTTKRLPKGAWSHVALVCAGYGEAPVFYFSLGVKQDRAPQVYGIPTQTKAQEPVLPDGRAAVRGAAVRLGCDSAGKGAAVGLQGVGLWAAALPERSVHRVMYNAGLVQSMHPE
eukprot:TRINITY_DN30176_c0_g1_i1.p1 TRINITY_DN30176_c0_g1~~TRINITY_DN30176_c0_g1_i1.p1  ORF type:complete len:587 (+),score=162.53 TRINITY_DN30176_c0_g1_i1:87-1763(+)